MPANATVPTSSSAIAATSPPVAFQPSARPVTTITIACRISSTSTLSVFALSSPARDSGVDPRRFNTP